MTKGERAAQIWPLLTVSAARRQKLTYDLLGRLIGVPRQGLGQLLEPIQSFCIVKHLPALTSLGPAVAYQDAVEAHATIVTPASHLRITH